MEFKIRQMLPVLAGLVFVWLIFLFSKFKLEARENANGNFIPANSSWVLHLDGKDFMESAIYDVVYQAGDEEIFNQLKALSARNTGRSNMRDAGIDFFSNVIIFSEPYQNSPLTGVLLNLSDATQFDKAMPELLQRHQAFSRNGNTGLILTDASGRLSTQALKGHALSLLSNGSQQVKGSRKSKAGIRETGFMGLEWNHASGRGTVQCQLDGNAITFSGELQTPLELPSHSLKPEGFHLAMPVFSQPVQDSLRQLLVSKGFNLPDIAHISANYRGTNLANGVAPLADLLIAFESEPDLRELLANDSSWNQLGFSVQHAGDALNLTYGNIHYVLKLAGPKTIFIGENLSNIQQGSATHLFLLQGDPTRLTHLEDGGLISMGINLYPPYKASRQFFEAIDGAEVKAVKRGGKYLLTGKISFKDGKYPLSESLRCALEILNGF